SSIYNRCTILLQVTTKVPWRALDHSVARMFVDKRPASTSCVLRVSGGRASAEIAILDVLHQIIQTSHNLGTVLAGAGAEHGDSLVRLASTSISRQFP